MAEGRQRERWNHTAALLALLANCHRDPRRSRPVTVADVHPYACPPTAPARAPLSVLRDVFVHHRTPEITP